MGGDPVAFSISLRQTAVLRERRRGSYRAELLAIADHPDRPFLEEGHVEPGVSPGLTEKFDGAIVPVPAHQRSADV